MPTKKLNHFVSRFHLKAWATGNQIWCLQDSEIFQTNVRNVAAENHFYRLREISRADIEFIREAVIKDSPERLKPLHENLLRQFTTPHTAKAHFQRSGTGTPQLLDAIERDIAEANENFHQSIEESFQPYLERLRAGDLTFLATKEDAVKFYRGLAVQYMRTNHRRKTALMAPENLAIYERTANVMTHILAVNIGYSLFVDHPRLKLLVLDNPTDVPFITADQPVINMAAAVKVLIPPTRFDGYYPVSPTKALLVLEPDSEFLPDRLTVTPMEAHFYNLRIASRAYQQVFASRREELEAVRDDLPAFVHSL